MNRSVVASTNTPLPAPLFWLEKGYPATLIFDPYAEKNADADRTQKRSVASADGTQEISPGDIEEIIPLARPREAKQQSANATQEVRAQDILEEELQVEHAPMPALPPSPPRPEPSVIVTPTPAAFVLPVHAPAMAPIPMPPSSVAPMTLEPRPARADATNERERVTTLATAEWERRRRVGHWLVGGALVVASAVVLAASAVHAFVSEPTDISVFSRPAARVEDQSRNAKLVAPITTAQAAQTGIQTVSIDSLPAARRVHR
jgi:hypothetical protein